MTTDRETSAADGSNDSDSDAAQFDSTQDLANGSGSQGPREDDDNDTASGG